MCVLHSCWFPARMTKQVPRRCLRYTCNQPARAWRSRSRIQPLYVKYITSEPHTLPSLTSTCVHQTAALQAVSVSLGSAHVLVAGTPITARAAPARPATRRYCKHHTYVHAGADPSGWGRAVPTYLLLILWLHHGRVTAPEACCLHQSAGSAGCAVWFCRHVFARVGPGFLGAASVVLQKCGVY